MICLLWPQLHVGLCIAAKRQSRCLGCGLVEYVILSFIHPRADGTGDGGYTANGSTRLRSRLLKALGYRVASVPFFEWDKLRGHSACEEYMSRILEKVRGRSEVSSCSQGKNDVVAESNLK